MAEYDCIDFKLAAQKVDDTKFTDNEINQLLDSLIEWAEEHGLGIGGGLVGMNDGDVEEAALHSRQADVSEE